MKKLIFLLLLIGCNSKAFMWIPKVGIESSGYCCSGEGWKVVYDGDDEDRALYTIFYCMENGERKRTVIVHDWKRVKYCIDQGWYPFVQDSIKEPYFKRY